MAIIAIADGREIAAPLHEGGVEGLRHRRLYRRYRRPPHNCKGRGHTADQEPSGDACEETWLCHPSQLLLLCGYG
jgi:hypothetical protein